MKRFLSVALASLLLIALFSACSTGSNDKLKVGMVTDSGNIDDKSFNQGTWEGLQKAEKELGVEIKFLKPNGETPADYTQEIQNLYDAGYKVIICPGFKFETAIFESQEKYKDASFVLLDGTPHKGDNVESIASNTLCFKFAEHEVGFLAGVAASLDAKSGELGFIGGVPVPAVQKFNWGFQQGVKYANDNLGTTCNIDPNNDVYSNSFIDLPLGQQLAATMYDRGVKTIFAAAGGVGLGVINEAKQRKLSGEDVWVVGVDSNQYNDGIYEGEKSVILTSAMKKLTSSTFDAIKSITENKFEGGKVLVYDAKNDGIGLPSENPNLSEEIVTKCNEVYEKIKSGEIVVSSTGDGLLP